MPAPRRRKNGGTPRCPELRRTLLAMQDEDLAVRADLEREGVLADAYHERMEAVHIANAARLSALLDVHGWPLATDAGEDGADAAWLVLMHSISSPELLRRGRELLRAAVETGDVAPARLARVEDRIRTLEGLPQLYGTLSDWDSEGKLNPYPIEQPDTVDERRAAVGLPPLEQALERQRGEAARRGTGPPSDPEAKRAAYTRWLRETGWR